MKQKESQQKFICRYLSPWFIFLLMVLLPFPLMADSVSAEYKLKAALIFKLTRFIEWPEVNNSTPPSTQQTAKHFGLCILGRDDFGSALNSLNGRKVNQAVVSVLHYKQSSSIGKSCQLVFISDSKKAFLKSILNTLQQYPILTIGDSPDFAKRGGMIQLVHGRKRIGFNINLQSAKASGLKISAPLLELSTIVGADSETGTQ